MFNYRGFRIRSNLERAYTLMVGRIPKGRSGYVLKEEQVKKLAIIALAAVAGGASAVQLYDNGTTIEGTNGGENISVVNLPASSFGPSCALAPNIRLADDFTVTGPGWRLTAISFYAYSTNASTFVFNRSRFSIVTGNDPNAGSVVTTNDTNIAGQGTITNGGIIGYRVLEGFEDDRSRAIRRVTITGLSILLNPHSRTDKRKTGFRGRIVGNGFALGVGDGCRHALSLSNRAQ